MSRNEPGFGGMLQTLVDLLTRTPREKGRLAGQDIVLPRDAISAIVALDSDDDIHLLLAPVDADSRYTRLNLRGLQISEREWAVAGRVAQRYLDVSCATGSSPAFKRPFLRFAEDVLFEVVQSSASVADSVYRTGLRWKRFWSPESDARFTDEWLRGLFGELSFLSDVMEMYGPEACRSWRGPQGADHDFQKGTTVAVEVKTSMEMPFSIQCNLRQLDPAIFERLYLVCYRLERSDTGTALPDLVSRVEAAVGGNDDLLDEFYTSLAAAGYRRDLEAVYGEHRFSRSEAAVFRIDGSFPRLTESSFVTAPDHRISNIRYSLQLTGVEQLPLDVVRDELARLCAR